MTSFQKMSAIWGLASTAAVVLLGLVLAGAIEPPAIVRNNIPRLVAAYVIACVAEMLWKTIQKPGKMFSKVSWSAFLITAVCILVEFAFHIVPPPAHGLGCAGQNPKPESLVYNSTQAFHHYVTPHICDMTQWSSQAKSFFLGDKLPFHLPEWMFWFPKEA